MDRGLTMQLTPSMSVHVSGLLTQPPGSALLMLQFCLAAVTLQ